MPKLVEDGDWVLYDNNSEYVCVHHCEQGAFSWEEGPQWTATTSFSYGDRRAGECMGCGKNPPAKMRGFIELLEWER